MDFVSYRSHRSILCGSRREELFLAEEIRKDTQRPLLP